MTLGKIVFKQVTGALMCATVVGCASAPTYDPLLPFEADASEVDSIVLRASSMPDRVRAYDIPVDTSAMHQTALNQPGYSPAAAAGGAILAELIIAAVDASVDASRDANINAMLELEDFDPQARFNEVLSERLREHGFDVRFEAGDRRRNADFGSETAREAQVDAALETDIALIGFRRLGRGWVPVGNADIRLISANGELLLQDRVNLAGHHPANPQGDSIIAPYDARYHFDSDDALIETEAERTVAALDFAVQQMAVEIADLLKARADCPAGSDCQWEAGE